MSQSSKISTLTKNTAWVYIGKIGTQILAFITAVLVIRNLDVDVYGTYSLLLKFIIVFNVFSFSPVGNIFNRYIPELLMSNDTTRFKRLLYMGFVLILASGFVITMLLFNFSKPISDFLNIDGFDSYKLALISFIGLMVIRESMTAVLTSALLHKYTSILLLASSFIRSVMLVLLLPKLNVNLLLYIEAVTSLIFVIPGIIVLMGFLKKMYSKPIINSQNPVSRKRVMRFGLFSSLNELGAGIVGKTSDYFIVSAMSNMHNVGLYAFATKIYDLIFKLLPFKEFMTVVRPLFFQKFTKDYDDKEFQNVFNFMIKAMMPVYIIPVLYFIVFGKSIILYIFDPRYISAYSVCVLVLMSNIFYAFFFPVALMMHLRERMDIALLSKIIVVFSIFAGIYAMKHYGIVGVAAVTLVGDFLKDLFIFILLRRKVKMVYRIKQYMNYLLIFAGINIPFYFISSAYTGIHILAIGTILYFIITYLAIIKFHPFNEFDLKILERMGQSNKSTKIVRKLILKTYNFRLIK
jgi:O-antigen/teichoic acid export membrane protein